MSPRPRDVAGEEATSERARHWPGPLDTRDDRDVEDQAATRFEAAALDRRAGEEIAAYDRELDAETERIWEQGDGRWNAPPSSQGRARDLARRRVERSHRVVQP